MKQIFLPNAEVIGIEKENPRTISPEPKSEKTKTPEKILENWLERTTAGAHSGRYKASEIL